VPKPGTVDTHKSLNADVADTMRFWARAMREAPMNIVCVDAVRFGVEDLDACRRFLRDLGVAEAEAAVDRSLFRTPEGSEVDLRLVADPDLPPAVKAGSTIREFVFGVKSQSDLAAIGEELSRDRQVHTDTSGSLHTMDDSGYGIAFRVSRTKRLITELPAVNVPHLAKRVDQRVAFEGPVLVRRLSHITYWTPDSAAAERFYVQRLKFRVTDRFAGLGTFMRASGTGDHHTLFAMTAPHQSGLDHFSFELDHVQDVLVAGMALTNKGWKNYLGPGRHIIGSNWFWYVESPFGGACELMADFDQMTDAWTPGDFSPRNTSIAGWMDTASWALFQERMRRYAQH